MFTHHFACTRIQCQVGLWKVGNDKESWEEKVWNAYNKGLRFPVRIFLLLFAHQLQLSTFVNHISILLWLKRLC